MSRPPSISPSQLVFVSDSQKSTSQSSGEMGQDEIFLMMFRRHVIQEVMVGVAFTLPDLRRRWQPTSLQINLVMCVDKEETEEEDGMLRPTRRD